MKRARVDGVTLAYDEVGAGEPVVCIHGAFVADAFRPLLAERCVADRYRLIVYRRRGYAGSSRGTVGVSLAVQSADCRGLMERLGLERAHVVGHSFGGAVALRLALDSPERVHTLALLEPALALGESADLYRQALARGTERYREAGARVSVDEFFRLRWPSYREPLERVLPGAFEQAVADAATCFESELPAVVDHRFGASEARRIAQPVLLVLGEGSLALHPRFGETHRLLLDWLPNAEGFVVSGATHFLPLERPQAVAERLAAFLARHPMGARQPSSHSSR